MNITRENAEKDLKEFVSSESLIKHSLAVEAAMMKMARVYGEDENTWGCVGLLHDIDFEKYPDDHGVMCEKILLEKGYPDDIALAIKGHVGLQGVSRDTKMAKTLFAVDQLSSFIVACALVRPNKFEGLAVKSVNKKIKDKAFARAVDREGLKLGAEELNEELLKLIEYLIEGLVEREEELKSQNLSLL